LTPVGQEIVGILEQPPGNPEGYQSHYFPLPVLTNRWECGISAVALPRYGKLPVLWQAPQPLVYAIGIGLAADTAVFMGTSKRWDAMSFS
jgi:hypothetical protein